MSKFKLLAGLAILAALSACTQPGYGNGGGINANCTLAGAAVGAGLGAVTDNNIGTSALVGAGAGALAGNAGYCN
jgi:hypothetical protein